MQVVVARLEAPTDSEYADVELAEAIAHITARFCVPHGRVVAMADEIRAKLSTSGNTGGGAAPAVSPLSVAEAQQLWAQQELMRKAHATAAVKRVEVAQVPPSHGPDVVKTYLDSVKHQVIATTDLANADGQPYPYMHLIINPPSPVTQEKITAPSFQLPQVRSPSSLHHLLQSMSMSRVSVVILWESLVFMLLCVSFLCSKNIAANIFH